MNLSEKKFIGDLILFIFYFQFKRLLKVAMVFIAEMTEEIEITEVVAWIAVITMIAGTIVEGTIAEITMIEETIVEDMIAETIAEDTIAETIMIEEVMIDVIVEMAMIAVITIAEIVQDLQPDQPSSAKNIRISNFRPFGKK